MDNEQQRDHLEAGAVLAEQEAELAAHLREAEARTARLQRQAEAAERSVGDSARYASTLLVHYFAHVWRAAGESFDGDNRSEVEAITDHLRELATSAAVAALARHELREHLGGTQ